MAPTRHQTQNRTHLAHATTHLTSWTAAPLAILLQLAHPSIALASHTHSRFLLHPLSRFRRTVVYIFAVTHGTAAQQSAIFGVVNRQHRMIRGRGYAATDGGVQKWVAVTLVVAQVKARRAFSRLTEAEGEGELDGLCDEAKGFATGLDMMESEEWPGSWRELEGYFEREVTKLGESLGKESREVARMFLYGMALPWWLGWVMPFVRVVVANWLPPTLRKGYGLPDPDGVGLRLCYVVVAWMLWLVSCLIPRWVATAVNSWAVRYMAQAAEDIRKHGRWMI